MADIGFDPTKQIVTRGRSGDIRFVPFDQVQNVEKSGGTILSHDEAQDALKYLRDKAESESLKGQARTASGALLSGVLSPFAAAAGGTGEQALSALTGQVTGQDAGKIYEQMRFDEETNPTLHFAASTLGQAVPAALAGELAGGGLAMGGAGKLAGAVAPEGAGLLSRAGYAAMRAAPALAPMAVEGATQGVSSAAENAFLENRDLQTDELVANGLVGGAIGLGIGAGARGASFLGRKAVDKAAAMLPGKGALAEAADVQAGKAVLKGAPARVMRGVDEEGAKAIGRRANELGFDLNNTEEALSTLGTAKKAAGEKLSQVRELANAHLDPNDVLSRVDAQVAELRSVPSGASERLANTLEGEVAPLRKAAEAGEPVTLESIQKARSRLGKSLRRMGEDTGGHAELQSLYDSYTDALESAVKRFDESGAEGAGGALEKWKAANSEYRDLKIAEGSYKARAAKDLKSKVFGAGSTDVQGAVLGTLLTGNPMAGLASLGAGVAKRFVAENANGWAAKALRTLAERGDAPTLTNMLAASSAAREGLAQVATRGLMTGATKGAFHVEPAGFAYGAMANYSDPKQVAEQYTAATNALDSAKGDPMGMAERMGQHLGGFSQENPELAQAAQMQVGKAVDYLDDHRPPAPVQTPLSIAFGEAKPLPPSQSQIAYLKRFRATLDPSVIYGELARGNVTAETVETLQTLYPAYLASVQTGVMNALQAHKGQTMSYSQRIALDNLFGGDGAIEPTRRSSVQQRLEQANAEVNQAQGNTPPQSRKTPNIASQATTLGQRLMTT